MTDKITDCEVQEDVTVKAIREEYERKLAEAEEQHKQAMKEAEDKHIAQIRALMSGREQPKQEQIEQEDNRTYEERMIDKLKKKFNLK